MSTEEFFKQYPTATKVHVVGEQMFTDAHRSEAKLHAQKTGKKMETVENTAPKAIPTEIKSSLVLAENVTDEAEKIEDEQVEEIEEKTAPKKRTKK